jgi:MFS family permease
MSKTFLLFFVILCEGYVVLACELLAIRQLIPFIGSGTECVAIVISGVLLPLAVGYHVGGGAFKNSYARHKRRGKRPLSIRKLLLKNILISLGVFSIGLSYYMLEVFFGSLDKIGLHHRLSQAAIYSALFLVLPVFLLGQTVPLISNYFSRQRLSSITGRMLFFSTTGSFMGSVFSTVVLMSTIGVHNTVIVTLGLLFLLCFILAKDKLGIEVVVGVILIVFVYKINDFKPRPHYQIVSDNAYNIIAIKDMPKDDITYFMMNRSYSSAIAKDPQRRAEYVKYIEHNFFDALPHNDADPKEILVIGAGGFTLGLYDLVNHYTFVDIDKDLKNVAEQYLHKSKLTPNKDFIVSLVTSSSRC